MDLNYNEPLKVLTDVIKNETIKHLTNYLSLRIKEIAHSSSKDRSIQSSLSKLDLTGLDKEFILEKIHDRYLKTRTISSSNINQDIYKIYHPLKLQFKNSSKILTIKNNSLEKNKISCIIGKAGQGKTSLLRKLFLNDIIEGNKFPILLFLRNIDFDSKTNIPDIISKELKIIGIDIPAEDWAYIIQSGKVSIYWDGFDEVPNKWRLKAIQLIESTWLTYHCPCVVTTRPDTEITRHGGSTQNITILDLEKYDIISIIKKTLIDEPDYVKMLIKAINKKNSQLCESLVTPILVDIFIYTYRSLKVDPKSTSDFYSELFLCLARQHDKLKVYDREFASGLTPKNLEDVFCNASYKLLFKNKLNFTERELEKTFTDCCQALGYKEQANQSYIDIINITNLIFPDGFGSYSYLHKSIMEFYAAKYILQNTDDSQSKFYQKIIDSNEQIFNNTIGFLKEINPIKFHTLFTNKFIDRYNYLYDGNACNIYRKVSNNEFVRFENDTITWISSKDKEDNMISLISTILPKKSAQYNDISLRLRTTITSLYDEVFEWLSINATPVKKDMTKQEIESNFYHIRDIFSFLVSTGRLKIEKELIVHTRDVFDTLQSEYDEHKRIQDQKDTMLEFFPM